MLAYYAYYKSDEEMPVSDLDDGTIYTLRSADAVIYKLSFGKGAGRLIMEINFEEEKLSKEVILKLIDKLLPEIWDFIESGKECGYVRIDRELNFKEQIIKH